MKSKHLLRSQTVHRLALIPALLLACSTAPAATRTYFGANNGLWATGSNWNPGGAPTGGDDVFLGFHSPTPGTIDLNVNLNAAYDANNSLNSVTLNSSGINGFMIVNQTNAASKLRADTLTVGSTSIMNRYNQHAGEVNLNTLNVGKASTQNFYNLYGGSIGAWDLNIGVAGGGTFTQTGGTVYNQGQYYQGGYGFPGGYSPAYLNLGMETGSSGTYAMSGGVLAGDTITVALKGTGNFNQSGGVVTASSVYVGDGLAQGSYSLGGGSLSMSQLVVGGLGVFNLQNGGTLVGKITVSSGGLFNMQGGGFSQAAVVDLDGTFRLNGHNANLAELTGTGVIEGATGNATLYLTHDGGVNHAPTTFAGTIQNGASGVLSLVKAGPDALILDGTSTYTGLTTVQTGTLRAGNNGSFSAASSHIVNGGMLDANGKDVKLAALSGSGGIVAVSTGSITFGSANTSNTYSGAVTGSGKLNKVGSGQFTMAGGGDFTGLIDVLAGSLRIGTLNGAPVNSSVQLSGAGAALHIGFDQSFAALSGASVSSLNFTAGSTLGVGNGNADSVLQGAFNGTGTLAKNGTALLTIGYGVTDTTNHNTSTGVGMTVNAGTLAFNKAVGTNALGGALQINGGIASLARSHQMADSSVVTLSGGAFNLNGFSETIGGLAGNGGSVNLAGGSLTVAQAGNGSYGGLLAGAGSFIKNGAGELVLTGASGFSGSFAVNAGRLVLQGNSNGTGYQAGNGATLRFENGVMALGSGAVVVATGGAAEYSNATVNNGFLRGPGTHTLMAGSSNAFNAVTTYNSTTLQQLGAAQFSNFSNGGKLVNGAAASINGGGNTSSGSILVNSTLSTVDFTSDGVIKVNSGGTLANSGGAMVLGGGSRTYVYAGGTMSTASGTTFELNGALLVNNGKMSGRTNVNFGSVLHGSGVFGAVNVTEGGTFSPGNSPGLAIVNGFIIGEGGSYRYELNDVNGAPGVGYDYVDNLGELTIEAGTTPSTQFRLEIATLNLGNTAGQALNFDPSKLQDFVLIHSALGITGFDANVFKIDTSAFLNPINGGTFSVYAQGNDLMLHFTPMPVPEPGIASLLLAGICVMGFRMRRGKPHGEA
ncbi:MAG: autotransporter-associated beta strand repeat-containing protein [Burkholderiaceae bacterium]|nr:autotransporter-associated beta strand repeat-containing protein [Burkholderiaceae bacterium]